MRRFGLLLLALALAWLVLVRGYADYLARPEPERALALSAGQPEALVRLAEAALRGGDFDTAQEHALRALRGQPLEGRALRLLGALAERRGDRPRALALMREAAARTPRDASAQFWLAINALADRELDVALLKLDRLVRFQPELQRDIFPILATIASNRVGVRALAPYLAAGAPWRAEFLHQLIPQAGDLEVLTRLVHELESAGGKLSTAEHEEILGRLWAQRDWRQLRGWLERMDPQAHPELVHDGGFDGRGSGPWRGWSVEKAIGADVLTAADFADGMQGLRLIFHDRRVPFRHVAQNLLLEPGRYLLRVRARLRQLDTAQGLRWVIRCMDDNASIGSTELLRGERDWSLIEAQFEVPASGCGGQQLRLQLEWRIAAEQLIRGEAWFDELTITRSMSADPADPADPAVAMPPHAP